MAAKFGIQMNMAEWPRIQAKRQALREGRPFVHNVVKTSTPVTDVLVHTEGNDLPLGYTRACTSPWDEFYLDPKGQIFACCVRGDVMGIAKTKLEFEAVLEGEKYVSLRRSLETGVDLDVACANCILRDAVPPAVKLEEPVPAAIQKRTFFDKLRERLVSA